MKKHITEEVIKMAIKDLIVQPNGSDKTRAELVLETLLEGKHSKGWDARTTIYHSLLGFAAGKMAAENKMTFAMVKKVYKEYPIFRKVLNPTLKLFLRSIEEYGLTMPQRLSAPLLVEFEITNKCNLACKHCYANAGKEFENELSTKEAKNVLNQLKGAGVPIVCFTGGEPLLRDDFFDLLKYANQIGLATVLTTNGTFITKAKAARLNELGVDYVRVSLDGASAQTHDWLRGVPGAFNKTVRGIKNCVNAGIKTGVTAVTIKENAGEMGKIVDLAARLGASDFTACRLFPLGKGRVFRKHLLSARELDKIEHLLAEKAKEYSIIMDPLTLEGRTYSKRRDLLREVTDLIGGCPAGLSVCAIDPKENLKPCTLMPLSAGNLKEQKFQDTWKNSQMLNELRDRTSLKGKCSKCEFKYSCGGCRATAYGYTGDYLGSDPITCMLKAE